MNIDFKIPRLPKYRISAKQLGRIRRFWWDNSDAHIADSVQQAAAKVLRERIYKETETESEANLLPHGVSAEVEKRKHGYVIALREHGVNDFKEWAALPCLNCGKGREAHNKDKCFFSPQGWKSPMTVTLDRIRELLKEPPTQKETFDKFMYEQYQLEYRIRTRLRGAFNARSLWRKMEVRREGNSLWVCSDNPREPREKYRDPLYQLNAPREIRDRDAELLSVELTPDVIAFAQSLVRLLKETPVRELRKNSRKLPKMDVPWKMTRARPVPPDARPELEVFYEPVGRKKKNARKTR